MAEPHAILNALSPLAARAALVRCCGAQRWVNGMMGRWPFTSEGDMWRGVDEEYEALGRDDYLEAFSHHPRIGEDIEALRQKFRPTADWSREEQSGVIDADELTLLALRDKNAAYLARFGYIFIVCATGKSAREMLALLEQRLDNAPDAELRVAAAEQLKITKLRLEKLAP